MFDFLLNPIVLGGLGVVVLLFLVALLFVKNYIKVPPNQVAVFTGRGKPKVVRGGGRFKIPGIERVDMMSIEPFNVTLRIDGAYSKDGVPVTVDAVGMVRFGSDDESVNTATQRFLTMDRAQLANDLTKNLAGSLRAVVATMSIESLNGSREELAASIMNEAGSALAKIGLEIDVLTIQDISDANGYLDALGRKRIAEVKRDADIGEAEAQRDAKIRSAAARQHGAVAEAQAETVIAEANRERDIQLAQNAARVESEQARAEQAGPLARAEAAKAVGVAEQQAEAARVEASVMVEQNRIKQQQQRLQADVIAPAEAERQAAIARAEGERQALILNAEANAQSKRSVGEADAVARKAAAEAREAEMTAEANGLAARLNAEAEGTAKVADALNSFTSEGARLQMLPEVLKAMVEATAAAAAPLGNIDRISIIGGADNAQGGLLGGIQSAVPVTLARVAEVAQAQGIDIAGLINQVMAPKASAPVASVTPERAASNGHGQVVTE